jgi:hypothetical protein
MKRSSGHRLNRCRFWWLALVFMLPVANADAAPVDSLFAAEVSPRSGATLSLDSAFREALGQVLVKVTGRRDAAVDAQLMGQFNDPRKLVQQYRSDSDGKVWVRFDAAAVKQILDASGQPVWAADRPSTIVWLALDLGGGQRQILSSAEEASSLNTQINVPGAVVIGRSERLTARVHGELLNAAGRRGLPIVLPLMDSEDLMTVSLSDLWGDFDEPIVSASDRYAADVVLIGRARVFEDGPARVRWTMLMGNEGFDWDGTIGDGPDEVADYLAEQLATSIDASRRLRLQVDGINSLDAYGQATSYLTALGIVESCDIDRVSGDQVVFSLYVRGDSNSLVRVIALKRVLERVDAGSVASGGAVRPSSDGGPDLYYRLAAGS